MKFSKPLISALLFMTLQGCDSGVLWSDPPYEVCWIDLSENRSLYYDLGDGGAIGRVEPSVIAVGSDEKYVVTKQRNLVTKEVRYYYVEKAKDGKYLNPGESTAGPFTEEQYSKKIVELSLPNFSKEFE